MSKADIMGLGPFLKALGERLDRMTKDEICRVLVQRGKTIASVERRGFLAEFESVPLAAPEKSPDRDNKRLIADIHAFVADLKNGKKDCSRRPAFRREIEALTVEEARYVTEMARRIAALGGMAGALDGNHADLKA